MASRYDENTKVRAQRASTPTTMLGTRRLAQPMAAELVRRLAPLHWDGSPN